MYFKIPPANNITGGIIMKNFLAITLMLLLALSLTACGETASDLTSDAESMGSAVISDAQSGGESIVSDVESAAKSTEDGDGI